MTPIRAVLYYALCLFAFLGQSTSQAVAGDWAPLAPTALGGIEFPFNKDISIENEVLHVSKNLIHVSYMLKSISRNKRTIDISFPMVAVEQEDENSSPTFPPPSLKRQYNLKFQFLVNGKEIQVAKRFFVKQIDITDMLVHKRQKLRSQIVFFNDKIDFGNYYVKNNDTNKEFFQKHNIGFACDDEYCKLNATVEGIYQWQQDLTPDLTKIEVKYVPLIGEGYSFSNHWGIDKEFVATRDVFYPDERNATPTFRQYFCIDDAKANAIKKATQTGEYISAYSIVYNWNNARYWQRPIKNFHLIIDKENAKQIVSYCPYIGKKTSPTRFEWKTKDFVPQGKLRILFLSNP
ncbi:DUF4424 domain-containing protein [Bartonella sp. HY329]|uniref:DUF4424 domain-containing protein n=1 Tax=unclassified Bartonella TaxID=2645622 RepID=UPI0021C90210|nr:MULTISPECIES: DUF4424 domain-containing protein [unclassified Bartonella]UXM95186.1 DUF4424 domain-containing protein [Bartonella sp. HY329]UXN09509.1 DUF4424 domain-containing protein [Bartonella sp. HY328]